MAALPPSLLRAAVAIAAAALFLCGCTSHGAPLYEEIVPTRVPDERYELLR